MCPLQRSLVSRYPTGRSTEWILEVPTWVTPMELHMEFNTNVFTRHGFSSELSKEAHPTKLIHLLELVRAADGPLVCRVKGYKDIQKRFDLEPRETINVMNDLEARGWIRRVRVRNRLREVHINPQSFKKKKT